MVLDSGDHIRLAEPASGRMAVLIAPWEITILRGEAGDTSAQNHLTAPIGHMLTTGNRVRVSIGPLTAEITAESTERLGLEPGDDCHGIVQVHGHRHDPAPGRWLGRVRARRAEGAGGRTRTSTARATGS